MPYAAPLPVKALIGIHALPAPLGALSSLARIDYADVFTIAPSTSTRIPPPTQSQAARILFGGPAPSITQWIIWRALLGLRLRSEAGSVAGWRVARREDGCIVLESQGWLIGAELMVCVDREDSGGDDCEKRWRLTLGTLVEYKAGRIARFWWGVLLAQVHRWIVPRMLRSGVGRLEKSKAKL